MAHDHDIPTAAAGLPPEPSERLGRQFTRFAKLSSSGGIVLLAMTVVAMVWANSPWGGVYKEFFANTEVRVTVAHVEHGSHGSDHGAHDTDAGTDEDPGAHAPAPDDAHGEPRTSSQDRTDDRAEDQADDAALGEGAHTEDLDDASHADGAHSEGEKKDKHAWSPLPSEPHWWMGHGITHWINDLLMAVFFLVVGLEIKREILVGELASLKRASLPFFGALGGMIGPALIYVAINWGDEVRIGGWGIPMATDIAFAVGILALLGSRIPNSLKVFLTSLAIVDDLGALMVIALFYTDNLRLDYLGYAGSVVAVLAFMNMMRVRWITLYLVLGFPLWYFIYMSGVHATIAGVLLAFTIPAHARVNAVNFVYSTRKALDIFERAHDDPNHDVKQSSVRRSAVNAIINNARYVIPPLHRIEHALHPWAAFVIIPVFALANAGIEIHGGAGEIVADPTSLGVIFGLFVGKPLGIFLLGYIAVKLGIASLPRGVSWMHIIGTGFLAGIGFTMAIFIANLAFKTDPVSLEHAKLAILIASALSAIAGMAILAMVKPQPEPEPEMTGPLVDGYE